LISDRLGRAEGTTEEITLYLRGFTVGVGSYAAIVLGVAGEYRDRDGSSDGLSSPLDRVWLKALRARADVIISSGSTVRAERLLQPAKDFLVVSKSGDLTGLRAGTSKLLVASDVQTHPSWPSHAQHFGSFASTVEVVQGAKARWQNLQVELGAPALVELTRLGLIDRLFVTAPTESVVLKQFGHCDKLFEIDALSVYSVTRRTT
jgi:hypothetical protein